MNLKLSTIIKNEVKTKKECSSDSECGSDNAICSSFQHGPGKCRLFPKNLVSSANPFAECGCKDDSSCSSDGTMICARYSKNPKALSCQKCIPFLGKCVEDPWGHPERPNKCCSGICKRGFCADKMNEDWKKKNTKLTQFTGWNCPTDKNCERAETKSVPIKQNDVYCCPAGKFCSMPLKGASLDCVDNCASLGEDCDHELGPFCCDQAAVCKGPNPGGIKKQKCQLSGDSQPQPIQPEEKSCHNEDGDCENDKDCCGDLRCFNFGTDSQNLKMMCKPNNFCYTKDMFGCCENKDCCYKNNQCIEKVCQPSPDSECIPENNICKRGSKEKSCCEGTTCLAYIDETDRTKKLKCKSCREENFICESDKDCCEGHYCGYDFFGVISGEERQKYTSSMLGKDITNKLYGNRVCKKIGVPNPCIVPYGLCDPNSSADNKNSRHCCNPKDEKELGFLKDLCQKEPFLFKKVCNSLFELDNSQNEKLKENIEVQCLPQTLGPNGITVGVCSVLNTCTGNGKVCLNVECCDPNYDCMEDANDPNTPKQKTCQEKKPNPGDPCDPKDPKCPEKTICDDNKCTPCSYSNEECNKQDKIPCCQKDQYCYPSLSKNQNDVCQGKRCFNLGEKPGDYKDGECCKSTDNSKDIKIDIEGKCTSCTKNEKECKDEKDCCSKICKINEDGEKMICTENQKLCIKKGNNCKGFSNSCCDGLKCLNDPKNNNGKICSDPTHCMSNEGLCDGENKCCPGFYCDKGSCKPCIKQNSVEFYCGSNEQCCDNDKDITCFEGKCGKNSSHCKGLKSKCAQNDFPIKCCKECNSLGECEDCVWEKCKDIESPCCNKAQTCKLTNDGETRLCTNKDTIICIEPGKKCKSGEKEGVKCCNGYFCDDKRDLCTDCMFSAGDDCSKNKCCGHLKCVDKFLKENDVTPSKVCIEKSINCIKDKTLKCSSKAEEFNCCPGKYCIKDRCEDCKKINDKCESKDECCSQTGMDCVLDGKTKDSKSCQKIPFCSNKFCKLGSDSINPKCCDEGKSTMCNEKNECEKCIGEGVKCELGKDKCCLSNNECAWNDDGFERICRVKKEVPCTTKTCDVEIQDPNDPTKRFCCGGLHCIGKLCENCSFLNQECSDQKKCCEGNGHCFNIGTNNQINRCMTCVDPTIYSGFPILKFPCNLVPGDGFMDCCKDKNYKCVNKFCEKCKVDNDECTSDENCCDDYKCCLHPTEVGKKVCLKKVDDDVPNCNCVKKNCNDKYPDSITTLLGWKGASNNEKRSCCNVPSPHGDGKTYQPPCSFQKESDKYGDCAEKCIETGSPCKLKAIQGKQAEYENPCCSGICTRKYTQTDLAQKNYFNSPKKVCGFDDQCHEIGQTCGFLLKKEQNGGVIFEDLYETDKETLTRYEAAIQTPNNLYPKCCGEGKESTCYNKVCFKTCLKKGEKCTINGDIKCCGEVELSLLKSFSKLPSFAVNLLTCGWDSKGMINICKTQNEEKCIEVGGNCDIIPEGGSKDDKSKLRTCCKGVCNSKNICDEKCLHDGMTCEEGKDTCCFGSCTKNQEGGFQCLKNPAKCYQKDVSCKKDDPVPCCLTDGGIQLFCNKEKCSDCIPLPTSENTLPSRMCKSSEDCCEGGICVNDGSSSNLYCFSKVQCRTKDSVCDDTFVFEGRKTLKCCDGFKCYYNPSKGQKQCVENVCKDDKVPCEQDKECCSNKCVQNELGASVCGSGDDKCVNEHFKCNAALIAGPDGYLKPSCCTQKEIDGVIEYFECREGVCTRCVNVEQPSPTKTACCKGLVWTWDRIGKRLICSNEPYCIVQRGLCGTIDDIKTIDAKNGIPDRKCCEKLKCYQNRCVSECKDDYADCKKDQDCCSRNCYFDKDLNLKCMPSSKLKCIEKGNICGTVVDNLPKIADNNCCTQNNEKPICVQMGNKMVCLDCLPTSSDCLPDSGKSCCSGVCGWDSTGTKTICHSKPELSCVEESNLCKPDPSVNLKKTCCHNYRCYNDYCKNCEKVDDQECKSDKECCSGYCRWNTNGKQVCIPEKFIWKNKNCVTEKIKGCISGKIANNEAFVCCEDDDIFCVDGECKSCKTNESSCNDDKDCCSKNCGWSSNGRSRICTSQNSCVDIDGTCEKQTPNSQISDKDIRRLKTCCKPYTCYDGTCSNCLDDEEECSFDSSCCSGFCSPTKTGKKICTRVPIKCQKNVGDYCGETKPEKTNIGTSLITCCKPDLICDFKTNSCVKSPGIQSCKKEFQDCEVGQCCQDLGCYYDNDGVNKRCQKEPNDCSKRICFPGILGCCNNKICINNSCRDCIKKDSLQNCCLNEECCGNLVCRRGQCVDKCFNIGKSCVEEGDCCKDLVCSKRLNICIKKDCDDLSLDVIRLILESNGYIKKGEGAEENLNHRFKRHRIVGGPNFNMTEANTVCKGSEDCNHDSTCVKLIENKVCIEDSTLKYLKGLEQKLVLKKLFKPTS